MIRGTHLVEDTQEAQKLKDALLALASVPDTDSAERSHRVLASVSGRNE